ncbi:ABC transporter permease [sulfur-oxidizing endosymbiont of Gigantopelta aegis]|uniref:ABC transporter permease n=1 Tax=sulfur-oxidizing endosymbiont of Gigantopelta aegis TaxID=2794934 RepID=UPI0018DCA471|nr:ABC transporter permease [sulfur-oxidizing endosymbiont of Gigantopelta aegis]
MKLYFSLGILGLWLLMVISVPFMNLQPNEIALEKILQMGDSTSFLGYDDLGRSIIDRLLTGAYTSFLVTFGVIFISLLLGTAIGVISGYVGGHWDHFIIRVIDIFMAFPGILLAIALAGLMGPGISNVIIALSVVGWVGYARLSRAQVMAIKQREHVQSAKALGASHARIIGFHILPLIVAPLIIEFTFGIASVVIAEAGLSFLGLGVQAPEASWGSMIRDGSQYLLMAPHMVLAPGLALMLVVLAVNLLGDAVRDKLDVKS